MDSSLRSSPSGAALRPFRPLKFKLSDLSSPERRAVSQMLWDQRADRREIGKLERRLGSLEAIRAEQEEELLATVAGTDIDP